ncbi:MAG: hypothetical protein GY850_09800 [bacterium]|nr:hypothetical protein [bacterium]
MRKWEIEECGSWNAEGGNKRSRNGSNSEGGPVAVPEGRDYAAAGMRKAEKENLEGMNPINFKMIERSDSTLRHSAVRYSIFCGSLLK